MGWDDIYGDLNIHYSPPGMVRNIALRRVAISSDIKKQTLDFMPGMKMTWYYSAGMEKEIKPEPMARYYNDSKTLTFVRDVKCSIK